MVWMRVNIFYRLSERRLVKKEERRPCCYCRGQEEEEEKGWKEKEDWRRWRRLWGREGGQEEEGEEGEEEEKEQSVCGDRWRSTLWGWYPTAGSFVWAEGGALSFHLWLLWTQAPGSDHLNFISWIRSSKHEMLNHIRTWALGSDALSPCFWICEFDVSWASREDNLKLPPGLGFCNKEFLD